MNVYAALERHDSEHRNYLIVGPWNHGSWRGNSTRLGLVDFGSDTAQYARQNLSDPWLNYHLGLSNELRIAGATVFETGTNHWRRYDSWTPEEITTACRLYLGANQELTFDAPRSSSGYDEYISGPPGAIRPSPDQTYLSGLFQANRGEDGLAGMAGSGSAVPVRSRRRAILGDQAAHIGFASGRRCRGRLVRIHIRYR